MKIIMKDPFAGYITVRIGTKQYARRVKKDAKSSYFIINNRKKRLSKSQWPYG